MSSDLTITMAAVLLIVILSATAFYLPRLLARRALRKVLKRFRQLEALGPEYAVTPQRLGVPIDRSVFSFRIGFRDYRPAALRTLLDENIVVTTPDGRLYLSEASLRASILRGYAEGA